jgi:hypothetical protein
MEEKGQDILIADPLRWIRFRTLNGFEKLKRLCDEKDIR